MKKFILIIILAAILMASTSWLARTTKDIPNAEVRLDACIWIYDQRLETQKAFEQVWKDYNCKELL